MSQIEDLLAKLPVNEQEKFLAQMAQYKEALTREKCQANFLEYVKFMWPGFVHGRHHAVMAKKFEEVVHGNLKRLIINMAPRHTKSEFASYLLPSWFLGNYPDKKVIQSSNTADLAVGFGRKVRNLVDSEQYDSIFPGIALAADSKAAGKWNTNAQGEYIAIGVGGTMTGKGADLMIIDDPHSEQEARLAQGDPTVFDSVFEWYTSGPRQRLQPGGRIVIVMTRWSDKDLTGKILRNASGEDWEVIELPAIMPSGNPLWPEFWPLKELMAVKEEIGVYKWNAQYQQQPTGEEGAIIKRESWKRWKSEMPPPCDFIIQSWDTAFTKSERADYSACTTWGVFSLNEDPTDKHIILLDAYRDKLEFPQLKKAALEGYKEWQPDAFIVEAKAAGAPLVFELRQMGIPVSEYTPTRGNDKFVRLNSVADLFNSGKVWAPDKRWADDLIKKWPGSLTRNMMTMWIAQARR